MKPEIQEIHNRTVRRLPHGWRTISRVTDISEYNTGGLHATLGTMCRTFVTEVGLFHTMLVLLLAYLVLLYLIQLMDIPLSVNHAMQAGALSLGDGLAIVLLWITLALFCVGIIVAWVDKIFRWVLLS